MNVMILRKPSTRMLNSEFLMLFVAQVIFDFRFLALLAIAGSLAGSLLCFLNVSHLGVLTVPCLLLIISSTCMV